MEMHRHSSVTMKKTFRSCCITTDSQKHILAADYINHCIYILDQDGQFHRYIDNCDLTCKYPWGVCVDNNDNMCINLSKTMEENRIIKVNTIHC